VVVQRLKRKRRKTKRRNEARATTRLSKVVFVLKEVLQRGVIPEYMPNTNNLLPSHITYHCEVSTSFSLCY